MKNEIIKLFACCIPVRGVNRSIISDLQRNRFDFIPNELFKILSENSTLLIDDIKIQYGKQNAEIIDEYFSFLFENEYAFNTDEPESFPAISKSWHLPNTIHNAIICFDSYSKDINTKALSQLSNLGCKFLELWCDRIEIDSIIEIIGHLKESSIIGVNVYIELGNADAHSSIDLYEKEIFNSDNRIGNVIFWGCKADRSYQISGKRFVIRTTNKFNGNKMCGIISQKYFTPNIPHYTESLHHNTCLNRKIAIDAEGNIKNCPSMKESYGNIRDTTLEEAINKPGFKKYWNIKKDEITKCKDCEFRHICTDCRAYIDNPDDIYSAPLKCGYDPYTCKWEEWSTNPLKQQAIDYYGMRDIIIKNEE